jgi:hypothetical protein
MGLFENNQLNRTKLMAIRQHIENNKEKFMKKLTFLQKSMQNEEIKLRGEILANSTLDAAVFIKKLTEKLDCNISFDNPL